MKAAENVNIFFQSSETLINSVTFRAVFLNGVLMIMSKMEAVTDDKDDSICGSHPCLHGGLCNPVWGQTFICDCKETPYTGT